MMGAARLRVATLDTRETIVTALAFASVGLAGVAAMARWAGGGTVWLATGLAAIVLCAVMLVFVDEPDVPDDTGAGDVSDLSFDDFERLVADVERAAGRPAQADASDDPFEQLVRDALDELPDFVLARLGDNVAVSVSDDGAGRGYYGLYVGSTVACGAYPHTIVIYRDTLVRDFGHDPAALRHQVALTVRHEVAHHLGAGERHVAELGL